MFSKLNQTLYPPKQKPLMVFDGNCGFCKYWVIRWKKISGLGVDYKPYQEVAVNFKDIEEEHFKEAVRYIDLDGTIYNGPDAAYITYYNKNQVKFLHQWYVSKPVFKVLSDVAYQFVADNRNTMSKITIRLFGKNPANPKPYWKYYLLGLMLIITSLTILL
ncbi:MAG: putative DCC family thiol-disulfide oxidoreductase YuxK [Vicingaceae bacterium]|jgi:predicted DCC family thiol-disulfide oxidoreductase YuxK